jgi:Kef-type K+ transport system membrane component KefB
MQMVAPQIGEFSFILTTSGVTSDIFSSFEADFLLVTIAASQFLSPLWSRCFIIWCFAIEFIILLRCRPIKPRLNSQKRGRPTSSGDLPAFSP